MAADPKIVMIFILLFSLIITLISCQTGYVFKVIDNQNVYFKNGNIEGVIFNIADQINDNNYNLLVKKLDAIDLILYDFIYGTDTDTLWKEMEQEKRKSDLSFKNQIEYYRGARKSIKEYFQTYKRQYGWFSIKDEKINDIIFIHFYSKIIVKDNWLTQSITPPTDCKEACWRIGINLLKKKIVHFSVD